MQRRIILTGLLAIALSIATIPAANAATTPGARHCVAALAPDAKTSSPNIVCYSTFAQAIAVATSGRVQLASDATTVDAATVEAAGAASTPAVTASSPLLGIEYLGSSYTGSSLSLFGSSGTGCSSGTTYGFSSLGAGWDNTISSAKSFSGCTGRHYDAAGYGGTIIDCGCSSMGAMDNRTSSILFF